MRERRVEGRGRLRPGSACRIRVAVTSRKGGRVFLAGSVSVKQPLPDVGQRGCRWPAPWADSGGPRGSRDEQPISKMIFKWNILLFLNGIPRAMLSSSDARNARGAGRGEALSLRGQPSWFNSPGRGGGQRLITPSSPRRKRLSSGGRFPLPDRPLLRLLIDRVLPVSFFSSCSFSRSSPSRND